MWLSHRENVPVVYPDSEYELAAEALADAAEDLVFCEDEDGTAVTTLRDAWQRFVDVAPPQTQDA